MRKLSLTILTLMGTVLVLPIAQTAVACSESTVGITQGEIVTVSATVYGSNPNTASAYNQAGVSYTSDGFSCKIEGYFQTQDGFYASFSLSSDYANPTGISIPSGFVGYWSETIVTTNYCDDTNTPGVRMVTGGSCVTAKPILSDKMELASLTCSLQTISKAAHLGTSPSSVTVALPFASNLPFAAILASSK